MKVYFTCSTAEFRKYRDDYFAICDFLIDEGHVLTRDWMPHTEKALDDGRCDVNRMKEIYKKCMKAISDADLVIIEDTVSNFSTGHQITAALQRRKPTLVLWQKPKKRQFPVMFIHGIESDILEVKEYSGDEFKEIIEVFIGKYENISVRNRFHLVLDNIERNYLDWAQFHDKTSRTKLIRSALRKQIEQDKEYDKYLRGNTKTRR